MLFPRGSHQCKAIKKVESLECSIPLAHDQGHLELATTALAHLTTRQELELTVLQIFPETTYPDAVDPETKAGAQFGQTSPPFYPSPWIRPGVVGWEDAYVKAKAFVSQLTLAEKVNLTTGVG